MKDIRRLIQDSHSGLWGILKLYRRVHCAPVEEKTSQRKELNTGVSTVH